MCRGRELECGRGRSAVESGAHSKGKVYTEREGSRRVRGPGQSREAQGARGVGEYGSWSGDSAVEGLDVAVREVGGVGSFGLGRGAFGGGGGGEVVRARGVVVVDAERGDGEGGGEVGVAGVRGDEVAGKGEGEDPVGGEIEEDPDEGDEVAVEGARRLRAYVSAARVSKGDEDEPEENDDAADDDGAEATQDGVDGVPRGPGAAEADPDADRVAEAGDESASDREAVSQAASGDEEDDEGVPGVPDEVEGGGPAAGTSRGRDLRVFERVRRDVEAHYDTSDLPCGPLSSRVEDESVGVGDFDEGEHQQRSGGALEDDPGRRPEQPVGAVDVAQHDALRCHRERRPRQRPLVRAPPRRVRHARHQLAHQESPDHDQVCVDAAEEDDVIRGNQRAPPSLTPRTPPKPLARPMIHLPLLRTRP
mmetsp:Transcript_22589/g.70673  ORF Transcript_22589/g.70673 Transcript_22589/m.70673 type:complete len:421 (-) Transcript_22589:84-1346(-)